MVPIKPWCVGLLFITLCSALQVEAGAEDPPPTDTDDGDRQKREVSDLISSLAQQFFNKGGQQGVSDLNNANNEGKMGVLQRYLGSALVGAVTSRLMGNNGNERDDLVSRILGSFTGGGNSNSNNNNYNNNNRGNVGTGTGYGSPSRPSGSGGGGTNREPLPGSNAKHGVSIIDSRPSDRSRAPSPSADRDDDSYSGSGYNSGNRDRDYSPSGGGSRGAGVSLVDSRPGDRRPNPSRGRNTNYNDDDFDTESVNGDVDTDNDRSRDQWGEPIGSSRNSDRGSSRGFSGGRRAGSSTEIFRGEGPARRGNSRDPEADD